MEMDSKQTTRLVRKWLKDNRSIFLKRPSSQSPDLKAIEAELKRCVWERENLTPVLYGGMFKQTIVRSLCECMQTLEKSVGKFFFCYSDPNQSETGKV